MKPEVTKALVLSGLAVLTFIFSTIPLKFMSVARSSEIDSTRRRRYQMVISFLSCFAAGVFLATCLLDLFPDVQVQIIQSFDRLNILTSFPIAEFVMIFGFFFILIIEQIVLTVKERHALDHDDDPEDKPLLGTSAGEASPIPKRVDSLHSHRQYNTFEGSMEGIHDQPVINRQSSTLIDSYERDNSSEIQQLPDHSVHLDPSSHSTVRSIILLLALSVHSIFEGLAVGLQRTNNEVLQIFAALVLHKCILAFSLGLNLVQSKLSRCAILRSNLLFSITSPLGIAIGILVDNVWADTPVAGVVNGVLQGIACGTFLYVTFFEVLPHEFNSNEDRLLKVLFLLLGYGTIVGLLFLDPADVYPSCFQKTQP